jgi:hypothetical protein
VQDVLNTSPSDALKDAIPILAVPEYKVDLPGGDRPSQNDLFVLARTRSGTAVIMVEGKVSEPFGPTLAEWGPASTPGKIARLHYLRTTLGLSKISDLELRSTLS